MRVGGKKKVSKTKEVGGCKVKNTQCDKMSDWRGLGS